MLKEEETIRYKDDGESKEMAADSAKKLPDDHPAKKAWLAKQGGDSDDSGEKVKGADLFKSKEGEPKAKSDEPKSPFYQDDSDSDGDSSDAVSSTLETLGDFVVNSGEEYSEDVMEDELQNIKNSGVSYDEAAELISKEIEKMQGQDEWEDDEAFSPETHNKLLSHLKTVYGTSESIVESFFGKSAARLLSRRIK